MANVHSQIYLEYHDAIRTLFEEGLKDVDIAQRLGIPKQTIVKIRHRLGIKHTNHDSFYRDKYHDIDTAALRLIHDNGYSINKVAKELHVDASSLSRRLKAFYNLEILTDGKKHVNSSYFHDIQTEQQSYWLGFIAADGYLDATNGLEITVKKQDREHLVKFKTDLESRHLICDKRVVLNGKEYWASRITIKDTQLTDDLRSLGIVNAKSLIIEMPDLNSLELYRHFLRGYFDGNGSILHREDYMGFSYSSGSYNMMRSIQDHAKEIVGVKSTLSVRKDTTNNYTLRSSSRDEGFRYIDYLYHDAQVYLNRKYETYQMLCRAQSILPKTVYDEDGIKRGWRNVS